MKNLQNKSKVELLLLREQILKYKIELAKIDFYEYCKLLNYDFYADREHLQEYCKILQDFHENKLLNKDNLPYKNILIEMPPRHGKTRTLILFCSWALGRENKTKIIVSAYNDILAGDFSKYTRNTITEEKNTCFDIVYSDVFEGVKIKHGEASANQWALEGQFFNYKGSGINGTITGKGGNILIIDDPVKNKEDAFNENQLDKIWGWYTGTWLSRKEHGAKEIVCHTPWIKKDLGGRIREKDINDEWFIFSMPACDDGKMLCSEILDYDEYTRLARDMDEMIFAANYNMERIDKKGCLYKNFKTYAELPTNDAGEKVTQKIMNYTDVADTGDDFVCSITGEVYNKMIYITGVVFSDEDAEETEVKVCNMLEETETREALFESNSGGRYYQRNVERITKKRVLFKWFHQTKNKISRILSCSANVQNDVLFPADWKTRWPEFYKYLTGYMRKGKNKHDDAPDTLTGLWEVVNGKVKMRVSKVSLGSLGI